MPGASQEYDVLAAFTSAGYNTLEYPDDDSVTLVSPFITDTDIYPVVSDRIPFDLGFSSEDGEIRKLSIHINLLNSFNQAPAILTSYNPSSVFERYGDPDEIYFKVNEPVPVHEEMEEVVTGYWMTIIYTRNGFMILYEGTTFIDEIFRICPSFYGDGNLVYLIDISTSIPSSFDDDFAEILSIVKDSFYEYEDLTGEEIDQFVEDSLKSDSFCVQFSSEFFPW